MSRLPQSFAALRHDSFRWDFIAQTVNTTGSTMAGVALTLRSRSVRDLRRVVAPEAAATAG